MTNRKEGVLYVGMTKNLARRVREHKRGQSKFTRKYNLKKLVWYKTTESIAAATGEEQRMKRWKREYKINLIEKMNPYWRDLSDDVLSFSSSQDTGTISALNAPV